MWATTVRKPSSCRSCRSLDSACHLLLASKVSRSGHPLTLQGDFVLRRNPPPDVGGYTFLFCSQQQHWNADAVLHTASRSSQKNISQETMPMRAHCD